MNTRVMGTQGGQYDVYIGRARRPMHFGNPFTHLKSDNLAVVKVKTWQESVDRFRSWITGETDQTVEPERRQWILDNLHKLKGKRLGCPGQCVPKGKPCHGQILALLADE